MQRLNLHAQLSAVNVKLLLVARLLVGLGVGSRLASLLNREQETFTVGSSFLGCFGSVKIDNLRGGNY